MGDYGPVLQGLMLLLQPENIAWLTLGFFSGVLVWAIPGLNEGTYLAVMLPFTLYMDLWTALFFMTGAYMGAEAGGEYPSILLNMPGTVGTVATTFEGYPLTQKGFPGQAIGCSVTSSTIGGVCGAIGYMVIGPILGAFALKFTSPEMFMVSIFGLTAVASVTGASIVKGLISGLMGLLISTTGTDFLVGIPRATFGILELYDKIPLLPALMGLFGFAELIRLSGREFIISKEVVKYHWLKAPLEGLRIAIGYPFVLMRSFIVGLVIGIIPGTGAATSTVVSYGQARQWSKHPELFGTGTYEGLIATDAANNASVGGAIIPTLTLGIPGSGTTVIFLAAIMLQGLRPGPEFWAKYSLEAYAIGWGVMVSALMCLMLLPLAAYFVRVAFVPTRILIPIVAVFCIVGVYTSRYYPIDIGLMVVFSLLSLAMKKYGYSPPALLLGLILGPMAEENFFRSLALGGPWIFFMKPISLALLLCSIVSAATPGLLSFLRKTRLAREAH
jgi:putative tricarboxylic transport membrane protein